MAVRFPATTRFWLAALPGAALGVVAGCGQSDLGSSSAAGASAPAGAANASTAGTTGNAGSTSSGGASDVAGSFGVAGHGGDDTSSAGTFGIGGIANGGGGAAAGGAGGANNDLTIVPDPSWTCGMPSGIPSPAGGTPLFSATLSVSATHDIGQTQYGKRRQLDVSGGTFSGEKLKGTVLRGGLDYELTLSTGSIELEEVLVYEASDNTSTFVRNCGVAAASDAVVRIVPDIEAPSSSAYAWLNTAKLVGTRAVSADKIVLDVYDVSNVAPSRTQIQLKDPAGVPNVSWDCVGGSGSRGSSVFTENVTLGSAFGVDNAKRGSRNIIPITGGVTTGKVSAKILDGGADYQLAGASGTTLDARYTLAPSDGALIIVRNCGPIDRLVPAFETATAGPYAFLNEGKFLSSAPGSGAGGVGITFYERQ